MLCLRPLRRQISRLGKGPLIRIGVDLMGGDNSPEILLKALKEFVFPKGIQIVFVGLPEYKQGSSHYIEAPEFIGMEEPPLSAIRKKKGASICVGLRALRDGKIDAFVSTGNTGALVSAAKLTLGMLPGVLRPVLLAQMPTKKGPVAILDVGASVQIKAANLVQFALIGTSFWNDLGRDKPIVGLLNIGTEPLKGTSELRIAYHELQNYPSPPFRFAGNVEGRSVFDGNVDILITDGFTGNVFLKTAEGIANLILDRLEETLPKCELERIQPQIADLSKHLHYSEQPGAIVAGVKKLVVKCHGYSTPKALIRGILGAFDHIHRNRVQKSRT